MLIARQAALPWTVFRSDLLLESARSMVLLTEKHCREPQGLTLTGTLLTPRGEYMANGLFRTQQTTVRGTMLDAIARMGLLLGLAALALFATHCYLRWRQDHR